MIVQAIGLLDDLDKELNTYAMRVREWYGWHFPEMTKIVADNIKYAKAVCCFATSALPFKLYHISHFKILFDHCVAAAASSTAVAHPTWLPDSARLFLAMYVVSHNSCPM